jgi:hypothetical protein
VQLGKLVRRITHRRCTVAHDVWWGPVEVIAGAPRHAAVTAADVDQDSIDSAEVSLDQLARSPLSPDFTTMPVSPA